MPVRGPLGRAPDLDPRSTRAVNPDPRATVDDLPDVDDPAPARRLLDRGRRQDVDDADRFEHLGLQDPGRRRDPLGIRPGSIVEAGGAPARLLEPGVVFL